MHLGLLTRYRSPCSTPTHSSVHLDFEVVDNVNKRKLCLVNFNCYPLHTLLILDKYEGREKRKEKGNQTIQPFFYNHDPHGFSRIRVVPFLEHGSQIHYRGSAKELRVFFFFTTHHALLLRSCTPIERIVRVLCRYRIA